MFYEERLECIGFLRLRADTKPKQSCLFVQFRRNAKGKRTNLQLTTSPLVDIEFCDELLQVTTQNSIYYFEEASVPATVYLQEKNLLELYLTAEGNCFCEGTLYDAEGTPHPLQCLAHEGLFEDSYLLYEHLPAFVCRYFTDLRGLCFYDASDSRLDTMLFHNESDKPLRVGFQGLEDEVCISASQERRISNPFRK